MFDVSSGPALRYLVEWQKPIKCGEPSWQEISKIKNNKWFNYTVLCMKSSVYFLFPPLLLSSLAHIIPLQRFSSASHRLRLAAHIYANSSIVQTGQTGYGVKWLLNRVLRDTERQSILFCFFILKINIVSIVVTIKPEALRSSLFEKLLELHLNKKHSNKGHAILIHTISVHAISGVQL